MENRYPLLARLPLRKNPRVTEWICEFTDWLPELRRIERLLTAAERAQPYRGRQLRNEARGIAGALVTRATGKGPTTPRWPESDGFMLGVETRTIAGVQMRTAPTLLRFKDAGDVGSTDLAAVVEGCVVLLWQTLCNVQARHGSPVVHLAGRARTAIDGVELLVAVLDEFRRADGMRAVKCTVTRSGKSLGRLTPDGRIGCRREREAARRGAERGRSHDAIERHTRG